MTSSSTLAPSPYSHPSTSVLVNGERPMPTRRTPTTFSCLTGIATDALERALVQAGPGESDAEWVSQAHAAHRDLTHALAHLGTTLLGLGTVPALAAARPSGARDSDRRLVMLLARRAALRDWEEPAAEAGTVADLLSGAARVTRAAADLWATHHSDVGLARSPEASRMRHPAMRGAALREWRGLVVASGAMAEQLAHHARSARWALDRYRDLKGYPVPRTSVETQPQVVIDLTVARPARQRADHPLAEVAERAASLRALAWRMSQAGLAPVDLLANCVAIGVLLAAAAEQACRSAAELTSHESAIHARRADQAAAQADSWRAVEPLLVDLRSPLPPGPALVTERRDLTQLLAQVSAPSAATDAGTAAEALADASERYTEVADYLAIALRRARQRRAVLLSGRALPNTLLRNRPDLLEAKLRDHVVVAPDRMVVRIEQTLRTVAAGAPTDQAVASG